MKRMGKDAVVVGGGLIGCTVARALAGLGLEVAVVERSVVGKEASFAAAVNRDDITRGAADLGVDLDEHITFCIAATRSVAADLGLEPVENNPTGTAT